MLSIEEIKDLDEKELLEKLYGKKLDTKNNILEYIEISKILKQNGIQKEIIENTYDLINESIDKMKSKVKPNTIMFLQNKLKDQFRKVIIIKQEPKIDNTFIKFFKRAYPEGKRNRGFTYVLIDNSKISSEQIWTTLTYINRECIKQHLYLLSDEKKDIIDMMQKLINKKDIKYINQMKSMDKLLRILNIKIVDDKNGFKIKSL